MAKLRFTPNITTRAIANYFGMEHFNVLRKARGLQKLNPTGFGELEYKDTTGRTHKMLDCPPWAQAAIVMSFIGQDDARRRFLKAMLQTKDPVALAAPSQVPALVPSSQPAADRIDRLADAVERLVDLQTADKLRDPGKHVPTAHIAKEYAKDSRYIGRFIKHLQTPDHGEWLSAVVPNGQEVPRWFWNEKGCEAAKRILDDQFLRLE